MAQLHPRGVQPFGNRLVSGVPSCRDPGLGTLSVLNDELMLELIGQLDAKALAVLSVASKALYCFTTHDDAWKALVLEESGGGFTWAGSWKHTYAATHAHAAATAVESSATSPPEAPDVDLELDLTTPQARKRGRTVRPSRGAKRARGGGAVKQGGVAALAVAGTLRVRGFYSDLLYQPWHCFTTGVRPEWLEQDNIERRSGLSMQQFVDEYEQPNRPVVITDALSGWQARKLWDDAYLARAFDGQHVIAGNYEMPYETYRMYCSANTDEMPLYLFDKRFADKAPLLAGDYEVPKYFSDDLFSVLGEDARPDYRWVLYPPHVVPPGVHPSPDGADVATPLSLTEWFLNHYDEARQGHVKPIECVVRAGELIFVPRGWWHMAMNLEDGVAVTQNFVSKTNLPHVLKFLRPGRSDTISGLDKSERGALHDRFMAALKREHPSVVAEYEAGRDAKRRRIDADNRLAAMFKAGKDAGADAGLQQQQPRRMSVDGSAGGASSMGAAVEDGGRDGAQVAADSDAAPPATQGSFSFGFKL